MAATKSGRQDPEQDQPPAARGTDLEREPLFGAGVGVGVGVGVGRRRRRRVILAWMAVFGWAAVIWILGGDAFSLAKTSHAISPWLEWLISDLDGRTRIRIFLGIRKSAHFIEYAILAALTFRAALLSAPRNQLATAAWVALFLVATLASADEARQAFSSSRTGSPYDVLIDVTGGAIAILGLIAISRRLRRSESLESAA